MADVLLIKPVILFGIVIGLYELFAIHADMNFRGSHWFGHGLHATILALIAVFITTLMMTGFLTLPVEAKFFGWKVSLIRNLISLAAALFIGFIMGFFL